METRIVLVAIRYTLVDFLGDFICSILLYDSYSL